MKLKPLALAMLLAACVAAAPARAADPPGYQQVRKAYVPSDAWLTDRHGDVIDSLRLDKATRRLAWTSLDDISPALKLALIKSEDQRFYDHDGIDWQAVFGSLGSNARGRQRGASTITMQLAGLLDPDLKRSEGGRTWLQKISQARAALAIEKQWTKAQILEAYLNLVPFRGELQGVSALSWNLFGKSPAGLDANESALAAALLRGPNATQKKIAERACLLVPAGDCERLKTRMITVFTGVEARRPEKSLAPHLAVRLLKRPGEKVQSTLDARMQKFARDALHARLMELTGRNVEDGAVVVLDNATGEVLVWVGSSGDLSQAAQVDHVVAPRQAGSTLKPFLYAKAIEQKRLTAASVLDDSPAQIRTDTGLYIPRDYAKSYRGPVSVRQALGGSLNVPAVRTLVILGTDNFAATLRDFGLSTITRDGDYYGYSLALGSAEVTLLDLTNAYRALANGGLVSATRTTPADPRAKAPPPQRAVSPAAAFIVGDMMADNTARALAFGFASPLQTRSWSAVKTGTSKDMRDNWALGFSSRYTVGVWVGNSGGEPMHDVSGVSGAAPLWHDVMQELHKRNAGREPVAPAGVVAQAIRYAPAIEPPRNEYFVAGTERQVVELAGQNADAATLAPRIVYPVAGTIVALDPDIPFDRQRMSFSATPARGDAHWELDGARLGALSHASSWFPMPGRHRLRIVDVKGAALDEVAFEVRGAMVKPGKDGLLKTNWPSGAVRK
ncbi:MAG: penicillin-binding protein [Betaproteobacteria bacterium]|nr:penicillin-binding protein [Betaproteobacteria bacterium]